LTGKPRRSHPDLDSFARISAGLQTSCLNPSNSFYTTRLRCFLLRFVTIAQFLEFLNICGSPDE
jgi:hypothetical protein